MGQEIFYCSKCQVQLRSADFEKEKAYRLNGAVSCSKCARDLVHSLPPETIKQLIGEIAAKEEKSAEQKKYSTSRILKVVESRPVKFPAPRSSLNAAPSGTSGGLVTAIVLGLVLLGGIALWMGSGPGPAPARPIASPSAPPPRPEPPREVSVAPPPPAPPPKAETPGAGSAVEADARESLLRARVFAKSHPEDLAGLVRLYQTAVWDASGTSLLGAAERELDVALRMDREAALRELPELLASARASGAREEFGSAIGLLKQGRERHQAGDWTGPIDQATQELRNQAVGLFGPLKARARIAAEKKDAAEAKTLRERIARWDLEVFRTDLENELASSAPPPPEPSASPAPSPPAPTPVRPSPPPESEVRDREKPRGPSPAPRLDSGLVARWKFDEGKGTVASDSSPGRNSATFASGASWTDGKLGGALQLSGPNASLRVSAGATLSDLGPLTLSAWIKPSKVALGRVLAREDGSRGRWILIAGEKLVFAKDFSQQELRRETANPVPAGVWSHIAATWDGSSQAEQIHLYVNAVEASYGVTQDGKGTRMPDAQIPLQIGNRADLTRGFEGAIDELRIYNRVLSAAEIAALAQVRSK